MAMFAIDRGGTFCDVLCAVDDDNGAQSVHTLKLLSVAPEYPDAPYAHTHTHTCYVHDKIYGVL